MEVSVVWQGMESERFAKGRLWKALSIRKSLHFHINLTGNY